ncbi:MAG: hypothetical protein ILM98_02435 [Kiritimatiellae bacterium]|nr:hypothetical protein [Kiritimatiellia bacterium]
MKRTVERLENGNLRVTVAFCFRNRNNNRKIVVDGEEDIPASTSDTMMIAIARGRRWQRYIDEGRFRNGTELAHAIGREPGKVAWTMRLAMLAPDIIHRILEGNIPHSLTLERLRVPIPDLWEEQHRMLLENQ